MFPELEIKLIDYEFPDNNDATPLVQRNRSLYVELKNMFFAVIYKLLTRSDVATVFQKFQLLLYVVSGNLKFIADDINAFVL